MKRYVAAVWQTVLSDMMHSGSKTYALTNNSIIQRLWTDYWLSVKAQLASNQFGQPHASGHNLPTSRNGCAIIMINIKTFKFTSI